MRILGLDISTSCTGFAIVNEKNNLIEYGAWDMKNKKKFPDIFEKAEYIGNELSKLNVDHIFIEQNLFMFQQGASSAKVLNQLSKFNGMVSILCYYYLKIKPEYISSGTARKLNNIKISKGSKAKNVVIEHLLDFEPSFVVDYTAKGNIAPKFYDMADAIVIAKAGCISVRKERADID